MGHCDNCHSYPHINLPTNVSQSPKQCKRMWNGWSTSLFCLRVLYCKIMMQNRDSRIMIYCISWPSQLVAMTRKFRSYNPKASTLILCSAVPQRPFVYPSPWGYATALLMCSNNRAKEVENMLFSPLLGKRYLYSFSYSKVSKTHWYIIQKA